MTVGTIFRDRSSKTIASYDWYDAGLGSGYKRFYLGATTNSAATEYFLTNEKIASTRVASTLIVKNTSTELNFDLTYNNIVRISGAAVMNFTFYNGAGASGHAHVTVYHVSTGAVETSLGTVQTETLTSVGAQYYQLCLKIALTEKSFGVGDKLRIEVILTETTNVDNVAIWFDPAGRTTFTEEGTGATIDSSFAIDIPFRIDL